MEIWKTIKAVFAPGASTPPDARRLSAVDEVALSASLRALPVGERGWITLSEARALFSPMDDQECSAKLPEHIITTVNMKVGDLRAFGALIQSGIVRGSPLYLTINEALHDPRIQ